MAGGGGHRHGSVCIRGSERCSCFGIGCLLVLGGRSGSRGVRWMSAEGWPSQYGRCGLCAGETMDPVMFPLPCFGCGIGGLGVSLPRCGWRGQLVGTDRRGLSSA
jgi:hypothetical protein